jgi:hypothetical protein
MGLVHAMRSNGPLHQVSMTLSSEKGIASGYRASNIALDIITTVSKILTRICCTVGHLNGCIRMSAQMNNKSKILEIPLRMDSSIMVMDSSVIKLQFVLVKM